MSLYEHTLNFTLYVYKVYRLKLIYIYSYILEILFLEHTLYICNIMMCQTVLVCVFWTFENIDLSRFRVPPARRVRCRNDRIHLGFLSVRAAASVLRSIDFRRLCNGVMDRGSFPALVTTFLRPTSSSAKRETDRTISDSE